MKTTLEHFLENNKPLTGQEFEDAVEEVLFLEKQGMGSALLYKLTATLVTAINNYKDQQAKLEELVRKSASFGHDWAMCSNPKKETIEKCVETQRKLGRL